MPNDAQVASGEVQVTSSEVQVTSREGQVTSREVQATSREVGELLKANTSLVVWLVFLAFGGGILALYYARIGYLPDIEWSSSIVYLAVASFIGGGVGLLLALSLLMPGLIWAESLLCDSRLVKTFCYKKSTEPCLRTILRYLGVPFGLALLMSHFALKADVIVHSAKKGGIVYSAIAVIILVRIFFVMQLIFKCLLSNGSVPDGLEEKLLNSGMFKYSAFVVRCIVNLPRSKRPTGSDDTKGGATVSNKKRRIFKYSSWFTLSVFLSQISMLVVYRLSGGPGGADFLYLTVICTAGVLISNLVVAVHYRHYPRKAIAASLVAAAVLLLVANQFSSLPEGIMSFYGFGKDHKVNLVVDDEGTKIIKKLGLQNICDPASCERLPGVTILSKLGSEYYLKLADGRTLTLPKSTVKSFVSTDEKLEKANVSPHGPLLISTTACRNSMTRADLSGDHLSH